MSNEYIYQHTFAEPNDFSTTFFDKNYDNTFLYEKIIDKINVIIEELEELKKLINSF